MILDSKVFSHAGPHPLYRITVYRGFAPDHNAHKQHHAASKFERIGIRKHWDEKKKNCQTKKREISQKDILCLFLFCNFHFFSEITVENNGCGRLKEKHRFEKKDRFKTKRKHE